MRAVPRRERERSNSEVAASLREALGGTIAGMKIRTRAPQGQFLLQRVLGSDEGLEVEVRGYDLGVLSGLPSTGGGAAPTLGRRGRGPVPRDAGGGSRLQGFKSLCHNTLLTVGRVRGKKGCAAEPQSPGGPGVAAYPRCSPPC